MVEIYDTDTWQQCARKIWDSFEVNQSCSIFGIEQWEGDIYGKGELVVNELRRLDLHENVIVTKIGKNSRKRKVLPDSIGGYVAHKIFRFKVVHTELPSGPGKGGKTVKYNIWRVQ